MTIDLRSHHDVVIIEPKGRLTVETELEFTGMVSRLLEAGRKWIVLDLAAVPYIDSCGLGAIAQAYVSAFKRGGDLKLLHLTQRNHHLLTITKLLTVFEAYDSAEEAVRSFYAGPHPLMRVPQAGGPLSMSDGSPGTRELVN
jgi:anti-sigma B factor antagonist